MMSSTVFLWGALALLCLVSLVITIVRHKQSKDDRCKSFGLGEAFLAFGVLPMAFVTIFGSYITNPAILNFIAFLRSPLISLDLTFGAFAGFGEVSFLMNFLTAIIFSSTVVITISKDLELLKHDDHIRTKKHDGKCRPVSEALDHKEISVSYIKFCRILS